MTDLLALSAGLVAAGFVVLAVVALVRAPKAGLSGWWAAAAFGSLALALAAFWLPDWLGVELPAEADGIQLLLVLAFPYLLLRFTATFRPLPRTLEIAAAVGAVVAAVAMLFPLARSFMAISGSDTVPVVAVFVYLAGVSAVTVVRLSQASQGQPGVARRRLRMMAAATAALTVALIAAFSFGSESPISGGIASIFALVSAVAFLLGFSPPRALRLSWRQEEDQELQTATTALLRADTVEQVAEHLVPATVRIMGGSGAAIVTRDGQVVASHGDAPQPDEWIGQPLGAENRPARESAPLGQEERQLVVWTSAYTPFFGPEELGLFRSMAAIGGLALDRCALLAEERDGRAAVEDAHEAAEAARMEAEEARRDADRANLAKSEFLSRMSHELRTPLNAILGFGQLLETADLPQEDRDGVGHILKAGRHLLALINDILDLSRIEAGTLTISLEPVHTGELIKETLALVRPLAADRSIQITTDTVDCEEFVLTDRQRCRQVLLNLLSNAIKYNRDGGEVDVRCAPGDDVLRISVRDTGPGIDPARRQRLFEPFERLGAETSGVEGTGLGLALTRQLVERLDGIIGVETAPGEGSTFWVELPLTDAPNGPTPTTADEVPVEAQGDHQLLLVEDNLANLKVVEAMLRRRPGISVLPAMQGTLALELAYQHRPDIIVLDLHLPDLPGREVLHRLKADPRTRDIPVIVASADATPGTIRQLLEDGAFHYVTKPLDLDRFLDVIDRSLTARSPGTAP